MRFHLSQRTFRTIVVNRPWTHLRCRRRLGLFAAARTAQCQSLYNIQRRYLFSFPSVTQAVSQQETKKGHSADHGAKRMMELVEALEQKSRPPPPDIIARALSSFIQQRLENPMTLTTNQVRFLQKALHYLNGATREEQFTHLAPDITQLIDILKAISQSEWEADAQDDVRILARLAYGKICSRVAREPGNTGHPSAEAMYPYLYILASTGKSGEALRLIEGHWENVFVNEGTLPWITVAKGSLKEEDKGESMILNVLEKMTSRGIRLDQESHEILTLAAAKEGNGKAARSVYEWSLTHSVEPTLAATIAVANATIWDGSAEWASRLLKLLRQSPTPEIRDAVLLLAVKEGGGAADVEKELTDLRVMNPELQFSLTISTFNKILVYLVTKCERSDVEDFVALAEAWGLEQDTTTGMLRVTARLRNGDIDGAMYLFEELDSTELTEGDNLPLWNGIVRYLCSAAKDEPDDKTVLAFLDRLLELDGQFEPATLEALCQMLLSRHDIEGIADLLKPFASTYSIPGISQVLKPFSYFIADQNQPTDTAWKVHELLTSLIPYAPVGFWTKSMLDFFKRDRPDLACLAFGHIRKKTAPCDRPTSSTYALCLSGIAKAGYSEGLFLIHNMLKLDLEIAITTPLLDSLVLAYDACGEPEKAMEFFREILHSEEGPSENSLAYFFRLCGNFRHGLDEADQMFRKLKSLDVPLNRMAYTNYIRTLALHGELERAADTINAMYSETENHPTEYTIGILYNSLPTQKWRDQAESWARVTYPHLWTELEKKPTITDEDDGIRSFVLSDEGQG
ncbi:hypothetical protein PABG_01251 [Paracoccidioides brasiliensis Pb03]|nr:hypothetical protein PABG_01251 [Paracoccidioides brasiliensis Pb03]